MIDPLALIIWSVGMVSMLAGAWITDQRDRRREQGELRKLCERYDESLTEIYQRLVDIEKRLGKLP